MPCNAVDAHLAEYLDGELPEEGRRGLEAHARDCGACGRRLEAERAFQEIYVAPLRPDEAPADVRERTTAFLARLTDPRPAVAPRWRRRLSRRGLVAAGVAGLLLAGGAIGLMLGGLEREAAASLLRLADASVEQHQKLARGVLPFDITDMSSKDAERWFSQKLEFNVRLPELKGGHLTFVGGRISHLDGAEVAALEYQVDRQSVALFVMPEEQYRKLGLKAEPRFKMVNRHGYDVIVWASHGVAYALVSEIGGRSCAVCHAPDEKLDVTLNPEVHGSR